ncbi:hypothetical protein GCM10009001_08110 [Virgibacillus siamensis]|uniref:DUF3397 family protein n=1 Tax=Virgibacillus siamensis TaxID=480071 RepID=A0ABN1FNC2_9BACI
MAIVTYVLIGLYAGLTGLAGVIQWKEKDYKVRSLLFVITAVSLLAVLWIPDVNTMLFLLVTVFIILHILAVTEGLKRNGVLHYRHHAIRLAFHIGLIFLVFKYIN